AEYPPNHLEGESSPYLRQHLHNPVDWYPWGEEAFEKARKEHKPIFLSIGYSTCHWCHVMARESFENPGIAELINRWFVPIKVDREEMPHLDRRFQRVYALLHHRSGGWPLTVFLTEEGEPFFAATYVPPTDGYGVKGLETLVPYYGRLYKTAPETLKERAKAVAKLFAKAENLPPKTLPPDLKIAARAVARMWESYDKRYHGWGERPKFPESARIRLLLDIVKLNGDESAKRMALETLETMAVSGLYDQIDGAFFRYCVDRAWTMPHFEKMLYTNAELVPLYVRAWRMTGKKRFKEVVRETIGEIDRRFRTNDGLYVSASDAESDHEEGGYFLYRFDEALAALRRAGFSEKEAVKTLYYLDIREEGNFDTELSHPRRLLHKPPPGFKKAREVLKAMRKGRTYPFIDRKVITAWNGMWLEALFSASELFGPYLARVEESYRALKRTMATGEGTLFHQSLPDERPVQPGMLEDYAFMAAAALAGYQKTLQEAYLHDARRWADAAVERFYEGKGRWLLAEEAPRTRADLSDSYYTSPLSKMLNVLVDLALLESDLRYDAVVQATLAAHGALLEASPDAYPEALRAFLRRTRGIVGIKADRDTLLENRCAIERLKYPFVLMKAEKLEGFVACDMTSCFGFGKSFEEIKRTVESRSSSADGGFLPNDQ
ncbi:thioredoxin domain-containing protein, partial [Hydrogenimonas sp.]